MSVKINFGKTKVAIPKPVPELVTCFFVVSLEDEQSRIAKVILDPERLKILAGAVSEYQMAEAHDDVSITWAAWTEFHTTEGGAVIKDQEIEGWDADDFGMPDSGQPQHQQGQVCVGQFGSFPVVWLEMVTAGQNAASNTIPLVAFGVGEASV